MSTGRICPPPETARDPGFLRALDLDTMAELVQHRLSAGAELRELTPDYVRWKEQDGSLLGFRARVCHDDEEVTTYVTARTAPPLRLADEAGRLLHRAEEDHAGLRAYAFLPDADFLLLSFPIDRVLPDLRRLVRASKVRNLIQSVCPQVVPAGLRISKKRSHCRIVRYKPERRAVLCWDLGLVDDANEVHARRQLWVRCHAEPRASQTHAATAAAAAAGVYCPTIVGVSHERLYFESHVEGEPWRPLAPGAKGAEAAAAAAALARLHGAARPVALPQYGPLTELDRVFRAAEDLDRLSPRLGGLAHRIADRLALYVPAAGEPVLAHGDMHAGQVLLRSGDTDAGLCDFDRTCIAPAALDLATMLAHCLAEDATRGAQVARHFFADYGRLRRLPDAAEQAWWNACVLVRTATTPFRALRLDWPEAASRLLQRAEAECAETSVEEAR